MQQENRVSLVACDNYDQALIDEKIKETFDNLGGIDSFVKKGQVVVLKPNLVSAKTPDAAVTTHPSIVEAVAKLVLKAGAGKCIIADSAGGPYTKGFMHGIMRTAGMMDAADKSGAEISEDFSAYEVETPEARVGKKYSVLGVLQDADVIINLCKLKTHSFTGYSGAVKNMFGAIPGMAKVEMHGKFQNLTNFNNFIYDVQDYFKPKLALHLMDAVVGMEGPGPTAGTPRHIGAIIAGKNPLACDIVGLQLIGFNDMLTNPTIKVGIERGYLGEDLSTDVVGNREADFEKIVNYKQVAISEFQPLVPNVPRWVLRLLHWGTTQRPVVSRSKCKGCKKCAEHCPAKAIEMTQYKKGKQPNKVKFKYNQCIRCYCCQELCPFGLVKVKSGPLHRFFRAKKSKVKKTDCTQE